MAEDDHNLMSVFLPEISIIKKTSIVSIICYNDVKHIKQKMGID